MKFNFKKLAAASLALTLSLSLLAGCSSGGDGDSANTDASGVKEELVVGINGDAKSLDPHGAGDSLSVQALMDVTETLVVYNEAREIVPCLAESWEQIDELSYKFNLKKGVKFHNGEEMKASDVVYSFKRATSPVGAKVQYIMNAVDPDGLEIVDDYTVIIRTKEPFGPFISYLPYIGAAIIPEKYYTDDPDAPNKPIGTGPLKFVDREKGSVIKYTRNDEYWGTKTAYKDLTLRIIPENNSRMIELETGQIDMAFEVPPNDYTRIQDSTELQLFTKPTTTVLMLIPNTEKTPLDNVKVRQAIDYAIDEESIVKAVRRDSAEYTSSIVVKDQLYSDTENSTMYYDVEKAKQLLAESGVSLPLNLTLYTNENQIRIDMATIIQTQLKEVGINLEIKVLELATLFDALEAGEQDLTLSGWGAVGFPDPDNNIYGPIHSSGIPGNNYSRYSNPELDALLELQRSLPNGPEREKAVLEAQRLIREETPYICIDVAKQAVGASAKVKGFIITPAASHSLASVYFE